MSNIETSNTEKSVSKPNWRLVREIAAVVLALVALSQIYFMVMGESLVDPSRFDPMKQFAMIRQGFQEYCNAFGVILLLVGVSLIFIGYNDKLETNPSRLTEDDE